MRQGACAPGNPASCGAPCFGGPALRRINPGPSCPPPPPHTHTSPLTMATSTGRAVEGSIASASASRGSWRGRRRRRWRQRRSGCAGARSPAAWPAAPRHLQGRLLRRGAVAFQKLLPSTCTPGRRLRHAHQGDACRRRQVVGCAQRQLRHCSAAALEQAAAGRPQQRSRQLVERAVAAAGHDRVCAARRGRGRGQGAGGRGVQRGAGGGRTAG
jgi:hypothetical protein